MRMRKKGMEGRVEAVVVVGCMREEVARRRCDGERCEWENEGDGKKYGSS
jgi:hypothetical protein